MLFIAVPSLTHQFHVSSQLLQTDRVVIEVDSLVARQTEVLPEWQSGCAVDPVPINELFIEEMANSTPIVETGHSVSNTQGAPSLAICCRPVPITNGILYHRST